MKVKILISYYRGEGNAEILRVYLPKDWWHADDALNLLCNSHSGKEYELRECEVYDPTKPTISENNPA